MEDRIEKRMHCFVDQRIEDLCEERTQRLIKQLKRFDKCLYGYEREDIWGKTHNDIKEWFKFNNFMYDKLKFELWVSLKYCKGKITTKKTKKYSIAPIKLTDCIKEGFHLPADVSSVEINVDLVIQLGTKLKFHPKKVVVYSTEFRIGYCEGLTEGQIKRKYGFGIDDCILNPEDVGSLGFIKFDGLNVSI